MLVMVVAFNLSPFWPCYLSHINLLHITVANLAQSTLQGLWYVSQYIKQLPNMISALSH